MHNSGAFGLSQEGTIFIGLILLKNEKYSLAYNLKLYKIKIKLK